MACGSIFRGILLACIIAAFVLDAGPKKEVRALVAPYLLPNDSPIRPKLDLLFRVSRPTMNLNTLKDAGFRKTKPRKFTKLLVTSHPAFEGYIFKLYLDTQRYHKNIPEHQYWIWRIKGAEKIRQKITEDNLGNAFKVPKKWIYELPKKQSLKNGYVTKYYILVEEDMDILSPEENKAAWGSDKVTKELLFKLYQILKSIGLADAAKPDNIPFSKDGRIAFIDTQTYGEKVKFERLTPYLSKENQAYWKSLTE